MPQVRVGLLQQDWDILAADTMSGHLSQKNLAKAAEDRIGSMLAALDFMADCEQSAVSNESNPEPEFADLTVNINVYEKTATGVMAAWSNFELGIDATKKPVRVSIKVCLTNFNAISSKILPTPETLIEVYVYFNSSYKYPTCLLALKHVLARDRNSSAALCVHSL